MIFTNKEHKNIRKLFDSSKMKDSDALAKLAYEFAQMANYFDRANSAHSREFLAKEDDVKYKEFLRKGLQLKGQLQREIDGMKKGMKSGQKIGYFNSYDNKTLGLLSDAISRLSWTSHDMHDKAGYKLALELDGLYEEYRKLIINGPRDSKAKDRDPINDPMYIRELEEAIEMIKVGNYKKAKFFVDDVSNLLKYQV